MAFISKLPWWSAFPLSGGFGLMSVFAPDAVPVWARVILFWIGVALLVLGSIAASWHYWRRNKAPVPLATSIAAVESKPPSDAFGQLGMADRIVVRAMEATGRFTEGHFQVVAEAVNIWDRSIVLGRFRGEVCAELGANELMPLGPISIITDPGADPGKLLVVAFKVPVLQVQAERLAPMMASDAGLVLNFGRVEAWAESTDDRNDRAKINLWEGLCIRGDGDRIVSAQRGYPQMRLNA